jgi:hypothetical protein
MHEEILILVARDEDRQGILDLFQILFPIEYFERLQAGRHTEIVMKNGDRFSVRSVEQWWDGVTCGMTFDKVIYLTKPPRFVEEMIKEDKCRTNAPTVR